MFLNIVVLSPSGTGFAKQPQIHGCPKSIPETRCMLISFGASHKNTVLQADPYRKLCFYVDSFFGRTFGRTNEVFEARNDLWEIEVGPK